MKGESKADSIDDTMLSVDIVGKNQDCSELGETMAAEDTKEDEGLVPPMKMDTFTFQWVTWRREPHTYGLVVPLLWIRYLVLPLRGFSRAWRCMEAL